MSLLSGAFRLPFLLPAEMSWAPPQRAVPLSTGRKLQLQEGVPAPNYLYCQRTATLEQQANSKKKKKKKKKSAIDILV